MTDMVVQPLRYWQSGGPLLAPLALVCLAIWLYFFRTHRLLQDAVRESQGIEEQFADGVDSLDAFRRRLRASPGALTQALADVLKAILAGTNPSDAFEACEHRELARFQRDLVVLAALTASAPLLGLLGTVTGMIATFTAVASSSGETAQRVASGISQALITTQFGLIIAIPGVFGLARLHRLTDQIRARFAACRMHLLLGLQRHSREFAGGSCA
jgi:biopolymer transport protein ExbB